MNALDALLARIDAELALPAFPPLEPRWTSEQLQVAVVARQELLMRDRTRPWWKRVFRRG
ncbi:MAG: hypothetical protein HOQ21_10030 [Dermatophilaceae bacterium]|nr:hypothetical protein [Dermatophilaceae bacterium]